MNAAERDRWKSEALDEIFMALASSPALGECLIFKGARVLHRLLGGGRQSLDIDSNLKPAFVQRYPDRAAQQHFLEEQLTRAVRKHFESQSPVRFELTRLTVRSQPARNHPLGWDAFEVRISVDDLTKRVRGLPMLDIDVAAPEELTNHSVSVMKWAGHEVEAYTLERIAGEKMRAFLSSLPAYRKKVRKPGEAVRAKDLYDITRIHRVLPMEKQAFWQQAGQEFRLACRSRYINCAGLATFQEQWGVTRSTYEERAIPKDIAFAEVEMTLAAIVTFYEKEEIIPFQFPLPEEAV